MNFSDIDTIEKRLIDFEFNEDEGLGFQNVRFEDSILSGKLIKRSPTFIQEYDSQSKVFQKRTILVFSEYLFFLDFKNKLVYVNGSFTLINNLKSALKNFFDFKIDLRPITLLPADLFKLFERKRIIAEIDQLVIGKFIFNNGIIGRFTGTVNLQNVGHDLIEQYRKDILRITLKVFTNENETLRLQISPSGNIKFISHDEDFEYFLDYVKKIIFI